MATNPTPQPLPQARVVSAPRTATAIAPKPSKLAGITPGALPTAKRFFLYGVRKWGKSTWAADAPVHAREDGRFARHADGRVERAPT